MSKNLIMKKSSKIFKENDLYRVIITKEIVDRDGELVLVDGIDTTEFMQNPIFISQHNASGRIEDTVIGKFERLEKSTDADGIKVLYGFIRFADTPEATVKQKLVDDGFISTVSMGFGSKIYDGNKITNCVLYEVSLVLLPANIGAVFKSKDMQNHYNEIKTKIKVYRDAFMSEKSFKMLELEKTGNEVQDILNFIEKLELKMMGNNDNIKKPLEAENQQPDLKIENQSEELTGEKMLGLFIEVSEKYLK